ncbi:P-loop containing nucleoside triphosphate hydrolase protein [Xylariomycetidae sp. FL0641]|nr:P-loop containing nucleoside triphosphate hydrolase protein [Xylariomycetidae sp. FL0641]
MSSTIWTEEEARYYRALLSWEPRKSEDVLKKPCFPDRKPAAGEFRFLVVGAKGCGKTSFISRICQGTFGGDDGQPHPNYERGCHHRIQVDDKPCVVDVLELSADQAIDSRYVRKATNITEAAILVYDTRSRESFRLLRTFHDLVLAALDKREYCLMLIGTKADGDDEKREVAWAEGWKMSKSFKIRCSFLETSAKTGENVDRIFPQLGKEVLSLRQLAEQREEAERLAAAAQDADPPTKRTSRWCAWAMRPWMQRRCQRRQRQSLMP